MGKVRRCLTVVMLLGGLFSVLHCDRGATGVESCVELEQARCEMLKGCPNVPIESNKDVANCRLVYHDQCEFGMADSANPDEPTTRACLAALTQAEACRGALHIDGCETPPEVAAGVDMADTTACQLLYTPRLLLACSFLVPPPAEETSAGGDPGVGGAGGSGGATN